MEKCQGTPDTPRRCVSALSGWWPSTATSTPRSVAAFTSIAAKLGMTPETLRTWVRRSQVDDRVRPGLTTDERRKLKDLEKEVKELRRANEILKDASIFFATELDGRPKK